MLHDWCHRQAGCLRLAVLVQPGARTTEVAGEIGDALKIRLNAPPVDGKANDALVAFLAVKLQVRQRDVRVIRGQTHRQKLLEIDSELTPEEVRACLL